MAEVVAVCLSRKKGTMKHAVQEASLLEDYGLEGDAHAGKWHRQVSLLASESVDKMRSRMPDIPPGAFAENILTAGMDLRLLPVGSRLRIGTARLEITQIGKECHQDCEIRKLVGDCVMPREGIFARVLTGGVIRAGSAIVPET